MSLKCELLWCVSLVCWLCPFLPPSRTSGVFKASLWLESQEAECLKCILRCKNWMLHVRKHFLSCWVVLSALADWYYSLKFFRKISCCCRLEEKRLMPESLVHATCKCSVYFCRAGMCSKVEAQQCASAFAGRLKGTLPRSLARFKVV